jgi:hypothetical protein
VKVAWFFKENGKATMDRRDETAIGDLRRAGLNT